MPHPSAHSSAESAINRVLVLKRLKNFSNLLDRAIPIPGTPYRIGLDPIFGLLPGGGDGLGALLSMYIIWEAARVGTPNGTIGKMTFNIIFEMLVGLVPVLGDLVDVAWQANVRNVALLEAHLDALPKTERQTAVKSGLESAPEPEGLLPINGVAIAAIAAISIVTVLALIGTWAIAQFLWGVLTGG